MTPEWFTSAVQRTPEQKFFEVQGAKINCLDWGGDDPDSAHAPDKFRKPGLLLIHGFMAHAQWFSPIAPLFMETHRVAAMDLSGMGDSDHRARYTRPLHAAEIAEVIRGLGLRDTTIAAHSFGGIPACAALIDDPTLAERLILIDSPVLSRGRPRREAEPARPRRPSPSLDDVIARFRLIPPVKHPLIYYRDFIAKRSARQTSGGWEWKFDNRLRELYAPSDPVELPRIKTDTWVIRGAESEVQDLAIAREIAARVGRPNQVVEIPASDHHIMIEQPLALVSALRAILASEAAPRGKS
jgi:pimeloyl-ACP methyl ester carboxylesterase